MSLSGTASMNPANLDLADDNYSFKIDSQSSGKKLTAMVIYVVHLSIQKVSTVEKTMGFLNFTTENLDFFKLTCFVC